MLHGDFSNWQTSIISDDLGVFFLDIIIPRLIIFNMRALSLVLRARVFIITQSITLLYPHQQTFIKFIIDSHDDSFFFSLQERAIGNWQET